MQFYKMYYALKNDSIVRTISKAGHMSE